MVAAVAAQQAALDAAHHEALARAQQAQHAAVAAGQAPSMTVTPQGGGSGITQVRKATAQEQLQAQRVMDPMAHNPGVDPSVERGLARVGHKFTILVRPDGTIVHQYGNDVPADQRVQVLRAAHRLAANGGTQAQ